MKRLAVVALIIGMVLFGLKTTFSKAESKSEKPAEAAKAAEGSNAADSNEPNEPSEIEKEFQEASKSADLEYQEAMRQSTENRLKTMKAMQKQVVAELEFIRSLAVEEGAVKTAKAVELAIEKRTARYEEMIQNMKERQERSEARAEREAKREQRSERDQQRRRPAR